MRKSTKNRKGKPGRKTRRTKKSLEGNNEAGKVGREESIWDVKIDGFRFWESGKDLARSNGEGGTADHCAQTHAYTGHTNLRVWEAKEHNLKKAPFSEVFWSVLKNVC